MPSQILYDIARIREFGLAKYGDKESWKQVAYSRYIDAAYRHFTKFVENPTGVAEDSGLPHLWHCACNIAFLCELLKEELEDARLNSEVRSTQNTK